MFLMFIYLPLSICHFYLCDKYKEYTHITDDLIKFGICNITIITLNYADRQADINLD